MNHVSVSPTDGNGGPFPSVGLTLTWFIWDRNLALQINLAWQWHDDSTAAVSNVEPNTVAPNSKDKTNHPSSVIVCK